MNQAPMESNKNKPESQPNNSLRYSGLAFQMLAVLGLATWAGLSLEGYLNLKFPVFTILFLTAALIGIIYKLIQALNEGDS